MSLGVSDTLGSNGLGSFSFVLEICLSELSISHTSLLPIMRVGDMTQMSCHCIWNHLYYTQCFFNHLEFSSPGEPVPNRTVNQNHVVFCCCSPLEMKFVSSCILRCSSAHPGCTEWGFELP